MKVAFIITDKESMTVGECLSSAKYFYIYDSLVDSYFDLEHSFVKENHHLAKSLSQYLSDNGVDIVVGKDLGPKAKASLEESGVQWYLQEGNESIEQTIRTLRNK